jgi:hypothetical protein
VKSDEIARIRIVFGTALLLSLVHYIDNTVRYDDYTGGKSSFITRPMIPLSFVLFVAAGIAGYRALQQGNRTKGGWLLAIYSISGLVGVGHFTTVSPSDFSAFQLTFIVLDFLAGLAVFVLAARVATAKPVSRPRTTSGRSPAESASR